MQSLTSQLYAFLVTIITGIAIGILFDFYKVIRGLTRPRKAFTYLGDLAFWIIATLVVFFMLLIGNWGEIRFYVVIGVFAGTALYMKFFSKGFLRLLSGLILVVKKIIRFIIKVLGTIWLIIVYPFIIIRNIVIIPVGFLGTTCLRTFRWLKRGVGHLVLKPMRQCLNKFKHQIKKMLKK